MLLLWKRQNVLLLSMMGVDNLMAVTNNCNLKNLLYKGGVAKSVNQLYNKKVADIVSKQTLSSKEKFTPTEEYYAVTNQRNDALRDLFHKNSKTLPYMVRR